MRPNIFVILIALLAAYLLGARAGRERLRADHRIAGVVLERARREEGPQEGAGAGREGAQALRLIVRPVAHGSS
ncbi:hypothetical protein ACRAWC_22975 [Leifsonia sp. L25]|uniref:hypothetical protein n=1 Tax=Leifsonia sp. L25 TaxID=3423957 RepID=UPI003D68F5DD